MKNLIYYSLFIWIFVCSVQTVSAQSETTSIVYTYDAAGNRTSRQLLVTKVTVPDSLVKATTPSADNPAENTANTLQELNENIGNKQISVFPNPTDGILKVDITNLSIDDQGEIKISGMNGAELMKIKTLGASNTIDISNKPNGTYLMELILNGKKTVWKIVKN